MLTKQDISIYSGSWYISTGFLRKNDSKYSVVNIAVNQTLSNIYGTQELGHTQVDHTTCLLSIHTAYTTITTFTLLYLIISITTPHYYFTQASGVQHNYKN